MASVEDYGYPKGFCVNIIQKRVIQIHGNMTELKSKEIFIFLCIFLFSLGSYYFYNIGLYVFQIIGVLLSVPLFRSRTLNFRDIKLNLFLLLVFHIIFGGIISALLYGSEIFSASKATLFFFVLLWLSFSAVLFKIFPQYAHKALHAVIATHILFFSAQLLFFVGTLYFIDFLEPITGESQRALGGNFSIPFFPQFIRATGLYNEPGTYSTWMVILLLLMKNNAKKLYPEKKYYHIEMFCIGSVLLSFSAFGIIFSLIYMLGLVFEKKFNLKFLIFLACGAMPFLYLGLEYLDQRLYLGVEQSGLGFRYQALDLYFSGLTPRTLFFGMGMFTDFFSQADPDLVFQDVGLWFVLMSSTGIVGLLLLLLYFYFAVPRNAAAITLVIVLMLSKLTLTNALVWVVLSYFLWNNVPQKSRRS